MRRRARRSNRRRGPGPRRARGERAQLIRMTDISSNTRATPVRFWVRGRRLYTQSQLLTGQTVDFSDFTTYLGPPSIDRLLTFQDWRILSVSCKLIPVGTNDGIANMYFSETPVNSPYTNGVFFNTYFSNLNNANPMRRTITWRAASLDDLTFWPVFYELEPPPVHFYIYSLYNTTGSPSDVLAILQIDMHVEARNLAFNNSVIPYVTQRKKLFKDEKEFLEFASAHELKIKQRK